MEISTQVSLDIVKIINTAKSRVSLDSPFIIVVQGIDFVGQFTVYNDREYITLESTASKAIYHDLRWEAGNIHRLIEWICTEAYYANVFEG